MMLNLFDSAILLPGIYSEETNQTCAEICVKWYSKQCSLQEQNMPQPKYSAISGT